MNRIRPTMNKGAAGTEKYNDVLIPSASSAGFGELETQSANNAKRTMPVLNCHGHEAVWSWLLPVSVFMGPLAIDADLFAV